jgi:hypothetical protein
MCIRVRTLQHTTTCTQVKYTYNYSVVTYIIYIRKSVSNMCKSTDNEAEK